ncbi:MAG: DUF2829 domain-containing protein [Candidatus Competibacteraceae bacterium]|nr:DUF2829 domain-containing protein [Candidatus Competibacteraceae bacterium]
MFESPETVYYGTKLVFAWPEIRDNAEGYGVRYEDGYVSWIPKATFEAAYRPSGNLNFGHALEALKSGLRVQRAGWNGKGMYVQVQAPDTNSVMTHPYLLMSVPDCEEETRRLPWQPAQVDIFANDWSIVQPFYPLDTSLRRC